MTPTTCASTDRPVKSWSAMVAAPSHGSMASRAAKNGDMALAAHPESFRLETGGHRVFVNVPDAHEVADARP